MDKKVKKIYEELLVSLDKVDTRAEFLQDILKSEITIKTPENKHQCLKTRLADVLS